MKEKPAEEPGKSPEDALDSETLKLLQQALDALPEAYKTNPMNHKDLADGLRKAAVREITDFDENTGLIFSKQLTFDYALGALLAKPADAGIAIAVIVDAENPAQEAAVEKYNKLNGLSEKKKILCADSVEKARNMLSGRLAGRRNGKGLQNFCYFQNEGENHPEVRGVEIITKTVQIIVQALREASNTVDEALELFDRARQLFMQAA